MATRNKTAAYIRYRTGIRSHRPPRSPHSSENLGIVQPQDKHEFALSLPPAWVDTVEEVRHYNINNIKKKIEELTKLHKQHLLRFDDRQDEQQEIEILTQEISRLFRDSEQKIKEIGKSSGEKSHEDLVKHNIQATMASELQDLSILFRKSQKNYLNRLRGKEGSKDLFTIEKEEGGDIEESYDKGFTGGQMKLVNESLSVIDQRDKDIQNIETSIHDLAEIFKDLATLVIDQGTILDRIDYNVEQVVHHTKAAHGELIIAAKEQKKSRAKYCVLLLLMLIFIVIILMVAT